MELTNQIIARMKAEGATSATSLEIKRCLLGCVAGNKLYQFAMSNRFKLCKEFCNKETHGCDCDEEITDTKQHYGQGFKD